jgi:hypothetical protein
VCLYLLRSYLQTASQNQLVNHISIYIAKGRTRGQLYLLYMNPGAWHVDRNEEGWRYRRPCGSVRNLGTAHTVKALDMLPARHSGSRSNVSRKFDPGHRRILLPIWSVDAGRNCGSTTNDSSESSESNVRTIRGLALLIDSSDVWASIALSRDRFISFYWEQVNLACALEHLD